MRRKREIAKCIGALSVALMMQLVSADTILVPEEQPTIQQCVDAASDGDVCSVAPGTYFEAPVVSFPQPTSFGARVMVKKAVTIRSRQLYQAILDGQDGVDAFLAIRAAATVEGFIIQNAQVGVIQRSSPDVEWRARNLIIRGVNTGISINDRFTRVGRAHISNVVISDCQTGFRTNDANTISITNTIVSNCETAFEGSNHNSFTVDRSILYNVTIPRDDPNHRGGELPVFSSLVVEVDPLLLTVTIPSGVFPFFPQCTSPAVDAGDPDPMFDDVSFPPSLGGIQNDIGGYGGPGASASWTSADVSRALEQAGCTDCGDGIVDMHEECDDANNIDGDGCNAACRREFCGDGTVQFDLGEECDDANDTDLDGCSAACLNEGACCSDGPNTVSECFIATRLDCENSGDSNPGIAPLYLGHGTICTDETDCVSLLVTFESLSAEVTPEGVLIRWTTIAEVDTIGFRILRETAGRPVEKTLEVVVEMIPAAGHGLAGASYEILDDSKGAAKAVHYFIEDFDVFGRVTRHGPVPVNRGTRTMSGAVRELDMRSETLIP